MTENTKKLVSKKAKEALEKANELLKNLKKKTVPELLGKDRTTTQSEFRPRVSPSQKLLEGEGTCTSSLIYSDINPMLEDAISAAQNKQNNKTAYTLSRAPRDALKEIESKVKRPSTPSSAVNHSGSDSEKFFSSFQGQPITSSKNSDKSLVFDAIYTNEDEKPVLLKESDINVDNTSSSEPLAYDSGETIDASPLDPNLSAGVTLGAGTVGTAPVEDLDDENSADLNSIVSGEDGGSVKAPEEIPFNVLQSRSVGKLWAMASKLKPKTNNSIENLVVAAINQPDSAPSSAINRPSTPVSDEKKVRIEDANLAGASESPIVATAASTVPDSYDSVSVTNPALALNIELLNASVSEGNIGSSSVISSRIGLEGIDSDQVEHEAPGAENTFIPGGGLVALSAPTMNSASARVADETTASTSGRVLGGETVESTISNAVLGEELLEHSAEFPLINNDEELEKKVVADTNLASTLGDDDEEEVIDLVNTDLNSNVINTNIFSAPAIVGTDTDNQNKKDVIIDFTKEDLESETSSVPVENSSQDAVENAVENAELAISANTVSTPVSYSNTVTDVTDTKVRFETLESTNISTLAASVGSVVHDDSAINTLTTPSSDASPVESTISNANRSEPAALISDSNVVEVPVAGTKNPGADLTIAVNTVQNPVSDANKTTTIENIGENIAVPLSNPTSGAVLGEDGLESSVEFGDVMIDLGADAANPPPPPPGAPGADAALNGRSEDEDGGTDPDDTDADLNDRREDEDGGTDPDDTDAATLQATLQARLADLLNDTDPATLQAKLQARLADLNGVAPLPLPPHAKRDIAALNRIASRPTFNIFGSTRGGRGLTSPGTSSPNRYLFSSLFINPRVFAVPTSVTASPTGTSPLLISISDPSVKTPAVPELIEKMKDHLQALHFDINTDGQVHSTNQSNPANAINSWAKPKVTATNFELSVPGIVVKGYPSKKELNLTLYPSDESKREEELTTLSQPKLNSYSTEVTAHTTDQKAYADYEKNRETYNQALITFQAEKLAHFSSAVAGTAPPAPITHPPQEPVAPAVVGPPAATAPHFHTVTHATSARQEFIQSALAVFNKPLVTLKIECKSLDDVAQVLATIEMMRANKGSASLSFNLQGVNFTTECEDLMKTVSASATGSTLTTVTGSPPPITSTLLEAFEKIKKKGSHKDEEKELGVLLNMKEPLKIARSSLLPGTSVTHSGSGGSP